MRKKLLTRANKAQHLRHNTRKSNMKNFLKSIATGPRIILVTGHFGSGKTEFSVSLAFALAAMRDEGVADLSSLALCDLDLENPYRRKQHRRHDPQPVPQALRR